MDSYQKLQIKSDGKMYLDGFEICNVKSFELKSSTGNPAELTVKLDVIVEAVDSELKL